jgi:hypothetical protein
VDPAVDSAVAQIVHRVADGFQRASGTAEYL